MIAIASIICGTFAFCFVVAAVMLERHKRFWLARQWDDLLREMRGEMIHTSSSVDTQITKLMEAVEEHRTSKAELQKILDDAGKFSLDVSERLEALRMDLIRVETMIGMGGKR